MTEFSVRLVAARKLAKLTQEEFARRIGLSKGAIGNWESGTNLPEPGRLRNIAEILSTSVEYLEGKEEHKPKEKKGEWDGQIDLTQLPEARLSDLQEFYNAESRRTDVEAERKHRSLRSLRAVVMELERRTAFKGVSPKVSRGLAAALPSVEEEAERRLRARRSHLPTQKTDEQSSAPESPPGDAPEGTNQKP